MTPLPLFLITPCRNAAATIAATMESVVSQPAIAPVHYHVQDGLSTDGTQNIIAACRKRLAERPDRYGHIIFTWASEKDGGMYDAIARAAAGLDIPPDALMGWINADDLLWKGCIAKVQRICRDLPQVEWMGGIPLVIDAGNTVIARGRPEPIWPRSLLQTGLCEGIHWKNLQQEGIFWRKRLWNKVGGLTDGWRLAGDWDLWRRMARCVEYAQADFHTAAFRRRKGQLSENLAEYYAEIEKHLPLGERRARLRRLLRNMDGLEVARISRAADGVWAMHVSPLKFAWYEKAALAPAAYGMYRTTALARRAFRPLRDMLAQGLPRRSAQRSSTP